MGGFSFEWAFRGGDLLTLIGGITVAAAFLYRRGGADATMQAAVTALAQQLSEMKDEIQKLSEVIISQARFDEKLTAIDRRVTGHDQEISDLRRGRGWIQGERGVDHEYGRT